MNKKNKLNKTKIIIFFLIIIAICTTIKLIAGRDTVSNSQAKKMAGEYKLTEIDGSREDVDTMDELGYTITLKVNEQCKGELKLIDETKEITFNKKSLKMDNGECEYSFENNKITFFNKGVALVFEKNI